MFFQWPRGWGASVQVWGGGEQAFCERLEAMAALQIASFS